MNKTLYVLAMLAVSAPVLAEDKLSLTTGFDYSTGKYGNATSTDILYVPFTGQYESGNLTLKLTVPYISVTGPGGVIQGFGRVPTTTASRFGRPGAGGTAISTQSGLGDVIASVGYTFYSGDALSLDAVGKVKLGTADANKGLGTGMNDYFGEIDGYYMLTEKTTLMATAGYKIVGAPTGVTTNNVPYGMIGFDQKTDEITHVGIMYNQVNSVSPGVADQRDVTVYVSQKLSRNLKVQADLMKGFSTSSPDYGGGLMITGYF